MTSTSHARIGATGLPIAGDGRIGPLAARLGLTPRHALAARRQAEREESRGKIDHAIDAWVLAITIESTSPDAWRGLARCLRWSGHGKEACGLEKIAESLEASWNA